ncbi:MAG: 3-hydroxyacyl-CoA dehydrogenase family protein [Thermoplasmata archaeon]
MEIKKIGVVGAGTMGSGIAQVCAMQGFEVILRDIDEKFIRNGINNIEKSLNKFVEKGKITADEKIKIMGRIKTTVNLEGLADVDLVIEAIVENAELKKALFRDLSTITKQETIFASNTSSISITELASASGRGERFIGMHFMNPVPLMKLVEIIKGAQTSEETTKVIVELATKLDKIPIEVNDSPGFVSNRVLMPMINEAIFCVYEGVATPEAVDAIMKLGMNHPMGPLELADLIGLDVCLNILEVLYTNFNDPKYRPCPLLRKMVRAGYLGRKTGRGFYKYS